MKTQDLSNSHLSCKKLVLVIEDDPELAPMLDLLLRLEGCDVVRADDGRQAEQLIDAHQPPDLVLMEIFLPYRGGFELLQKIRSKSSWNGSYVAMLSNNASGADGFRARAGGAEECLVKPLHSESLRRLLTNAGRILHTASLSAHAVA